MFYFVNLSFYYGLWGGIGVEMLGCFYGGGVD